MNKMNKMNTSTELVFRQVISLPDATKIMAKLKQRKHRCYEWTYELDELSNDETAEVLRSMIEGEEVFKSLSVYRQYSFDSRAAIAFNRGENLYVLSVFRGPVANK